MIDLCIVLYGLTCFWIGYLVRHAIQLKRTRKEHNEAILDIILGRHRRSSDT